MSIFLFTGPKSRRSNSSTCFSSVTCPWS